MRPLSRTSSRALSPTLEGGRDRCRIGEPVGLDGDALETGPSAQAAAQHLDQVIPHVDGQQMQPFFIW
jgi:hypothetical protein